MLWVVCDHTKSHDKKLEGGGGGRSGEGGMTEGHNKINRT